MTSAVESLVPGPRCRRIEPLLREDASRPEIEETFKKMVRHARSAEGRWRCLTNSTLAEVAPHDLVVFAGHRAELATCAAIDLAAA